MGFLLTGFTVPVLAVFLFSRLLVSTNKRTKLNYFALLILTLSGTYIGSHSLFGALPLPHLYNPTDHFMDFWNVAYQASTEVTYEMGGFYHPLTTYLMSFFDVSTYQRSHELRDSNHFITLLCIALIFVGSALIAYPIARHGSI